MPVVLGPLVCGQLGMATSSYEDNKHLVLLPPRAALSANDTQPVARDRVVRGPCVWQTFGPPSGETPICKNSLDCLSPQGLGAVRAEDFL